MRPHFILSTRKFLAVCAFSLVFAATAFADVIVLKDGDRVTGSIVKKDGATVTVKSKNFGTVTLKWDNIATISTADPLHVVLSGDRTVKATLESKGAAIALTGPAAPQSVPPAEIVALRNDTEQAAYERYLRPGLLDLWTITGSLNLAGAKGNAESSTLTTPLNFLRNSRTSRTSAYFNSIRSTATLNGVSAQTALAVRGGWAFSRNLNKKIFANAFNDYDYDKFQFLDLRVVAGGGLGYQFWSAEKGRLALIAGGAWNREKFAPRDAAEFSRNSAEIYWGDDFHYKLNSRTTINQSYRMFNNMTTTGVYRINFDAGAATQLTKWLTWNISLSDRYLSNPVPGRKKNDLLYTTGIGFSFSR